MQILCVVHADFETPGVIENWAEKLGHPFQICKPYAGENCLNQPEFDFLILMGGPQSPLELERFPYLQDEIVLIQRAIAQGKKILGFCLGAQLIGEALGGMTVRSPEKEVGVFPITVLPSGRHDPLLQGLPTQFPVIHWHNDMPGETSNSVILAYSEGCPRQIIKYAPKIYGFQCHLEITLEGIKQMIQACPADLKPSTFTQTALELQDQDYNSINQVMVEILERFSILE